MTSRGRKAKLNRKQILEVALKLVDEGGVGALSMRKLATELGVDPMAIYHHVPNKDTLISGITEMVYGTLRLEIDPALHWREQIRAFTSAYRQIVRAHPHLIVHLIMNPPYGMPVGMQANEQLYAALIQSGLPPRQIVRAADAIIDFLHGYAISESSFPAEGTFSREHELNVYDGYPALRQVFEALGPDNLRVDFDPELEFLLAGIEAVAARSS